MVILAQLVRATDCGSVGRGFETHISPLVKMNEKVGPLRFDFLIMMVRLVHPTTFVKQYIS